MTPSLPNHYPETVSEWIEWGGSTLQNRLENPREESRYLMEALLKSKTAVWTHSSSSLTSEKALIFQNWIGRRLQREPFHLIVGSVEFWKRSFIVRPGVLIPRPETEILVESCLEALGSLKKKSDPLRILDLGAGSGAIILSILLEVPGALGVAVEKDSSALAVLLENRHRFDLENRLSVILGEWGRMLVSEPVFDCIVSNPPYVRTSLLATLEPEIRDYEPTSALDGGEDGLRDYREILSFAPTLLKDGGILAFEIGSDQADSDIFKDITCSGKECGFSAGPEILQDVSGRDRVILWRKKE